MVLGQGEGIILSPVLEMYFYFYFFFPKMGWEQRGQCLLPL